MYSTVGQVSYITGDFGKYDKKIKNYNVRYGRNAIDNYKKYLYNYVQPNVELNVPVSPLRQKNMDIFERISYFFKNLMFEHKMKKLEKQTAKMKEYESRRTPMKFVMQYMPNAADIKGKLQALMGASFEEMGQKTKVSVQEMNDTLKQGGDIGLTADALDINQDGYITTGEYATSTLLSDALSEDSKFNSKNINGVINNEGMNNLLAYSTEKNVTAAREVFSALYEHFNLGEVEKEFLSSKNNLKK